MKRGNRLGQGAGRTSKSQRESGALKGLALDVTRQPVDLSTLPYLTLAEAASYLRLSEKGLRCRMDRGTVPPWCWTRLGGSLRFNRRALDELLEPKDRKAALQILRGMRG